MKTLDFKPLTPKIVLGIAAHADDLDYGAAGTMATFAAAGAAVHYLILTDGSKGSGDSDLSTAELIDMREAEQREATKVIGGKSVQFLNYPDGELEVTMDLKKDIVKVIRTIKPDVVVTNDPSTFYAVQRGFINHPDHRAAGQAALDAVFPLARDRLTFPELFAEGYQPHKVSTVLLMNLETGNYLVDITDTFETKIAVLKAHASQVGDIAATREWMKEIASDYGQQAGYSLAESFMRIDIRS